MSDETQQGEESTAGATRRLRWAQGLTALAAMGSATGLDITGGWDHNPQSWIVLVVSAPFALYAVWCAWRLRGVQS